MWWKAILHAVSIVLPQAEHRHCARHIYAHWHKTYKGDEFKLLFWKIAKAYNMTDYEDALQELKNIDDDAATAFVSYKPPLFCRAYMDPSIKSDAITNNMAETFNGYIVKARTKHLLYMMEDIRTALMQRLVKKRKEMEKVTSQICPRIQAILEREKGFATDCEVQPSSNTLFNVIYYLDSLVVDIEAKTCTCRKWDMTGVPCRHAIACIFFLHQQAEHYVDDYFKRSVYLETQYAGNTYKSVYTFYWYTTHYCLIIH